jgi:hypothetical protein
MASAMIRATDESVEEMAGGDLGEPGVGVGGVAVRGRDGLGGGPEEFRTELSAVLVSACEQTVTSAALAATGCLVELVTATQTLSALVGASRFGLNLGLTGAIR